ncbi:MAG: 1-(5-phosphoribosyl)-5-[(5-phosphoribosylamino)methylideneamino] imidazole-4-carboxamide isomerase, partial [Thermoleophilia bacterium]|nr:1-(5-phosphoribosyl)-5-[(5-phosphoribosylamino)methylideneamino] imidazole-4-carboxamide isomerase [Thermoleophilia bacterium]
MILYPAIDIRGGKAVRLAQGEYDRETRYDDDPVDAARRWADGGAEYLHVVDLDGARTGRPANLETVRRIAEAVECPIEVGGGLRDGDAVSDLIGAGAGRVVIGTAALRDPAFLERVISDHGPEKTVVSIDARGGKVFLAGWTESSGVDAAEAVADLTRIGVERFLFTPIEVDGMMTGPNLPELKRVASATAARIIASGGV